MMNRFKYFLFVTAICLFSLISLQAAATPVLAVCGTTTVSVLPSTVFGVTLNALPWSNANGTTTYSMPGTYAEYCPSWHCPCGGSPIGYGGYSEFGYRDCSCGATVSFIRGTCGEAGNCYCNSGYSSQSSTCWWNGSGCVEWTPSAYKDGTIQTCSYY